MFDTLMLALLGHHSWDHAYADPALYEWLLKQHRKQPVAAAAGASQ